MQIKTRLEEQAAAGAATATAGAALAAGSGAAPFVPEAVHGAVERATNGVALAQGSTQAAAEAASSGIHRMAAALNGSVPIDNIAKSAAGFEQTQVHMTEGMNKAMKTAEEFVAFGQGNLEALVRSGQIWATGMQDLGKLVAATAQAQIEDTVSAFKAIAGAKSVKDAFEVQTSLARTTIEKTLAESGRLTETSMRLTEQALAPVTARVSLAVEKFGRTV